MGMKLVLHIGLPKTGTTYLQEMIFPRLPNVRYLGKLKSDILQPESGPACGILSQIFTCTTKIWSSLGERLFSEFIGPAPEFGGDCRTVLVSDEGVGKAGKHPEHMQLHLKNLVEKAREWGYGDVGVVCVFRRQDQWIGSHYAQVSDRINGASQANFETYVYDRISETGNYYKYGMLLDYSGLREGLCEVLGDGNILMIPYEMFSDDATEYLSAILNFIDPQARLETKNLSGESPGHLNGRERNRRSSGIDRWVVRTNTASTSSIRLRPTRVFSRLGFPTTISWHKPHAGRPMEVVMTPELKSAILRVYAQSNRKLAGDLGMDLSPYGYY